MLDRLKAHGFEVEFTSHAEAIMVHDFPDLLNELEAALLEISLPMTEIVCGGGGEAKMTQRLRRGLAAMHWAKHNFELTKIVDGVAKESIMCVVRRTACSRSKSNGTTRTPSSTVIWRISNDFMQRVRLASAAL